MPYVTFNYFGLEAGGCLSSPAAAGGSVSALGSAVILYVLFSLRVKKLSCCPFFYASNLSKKFHMFKYLLIFQFSKSLQNDGMNSYVVDDAQWPRAWNQVCAIKIRQNVFSITPK